MEKQPGVSVIVPIRNEEKFIEDTLTSVCNQTFPKEDYEIIIADGLSTDGTLEIIKNVQERFPKHHIQVISNEGQIVPTGLNEAIRCAKGKIILRVDGHCEINKNYISTCVKLLKSKDVDVVGGVIDTIGQNYVAKTIAISMSSNFGVGGSPFRVNQEKEIFVDSVAFPAFTHEIIEKVGLFDEELVRNQDDEYTYRIRKAGGKILLSPELRSKYYSRASLKKLFKQYYQYGFWKIRVLQKHPLQMRPRQFAPFLFVVLLLASLGLMPFSQLGLWFFTSIMCVYLVANITASIIEANKNGWNYLLLFPAVFGTLHISYGVGFLVGLFRFSHRWGDREGKVPKFDFDTHLDSEGSAS